MAPWASTMMDLLWQSALAVIPLALLVMVLCHFLPAKPSTRHSLYLLVLAWLVVAPMLPAMQPAPIGSAVPGASDSAADLVLTNAGRTAVRDAFLDRDATIKLDSPRSFLEGGLTAALGLRPTTAPPLLPAPPTVGGHKRTVGLDEYPAVARLAPFPDSSGLPLRSSSIPVDDGGTPLRPLHSPKSMPGPELGQVAIRPTTERVLTQEAMVDLGTPPSGETLLTEQSYAELALGTGEDRAGDPGAPGALTDGPALTSRPILATNVTSPGDVASPLPVEVAAGVEPDAPPSVWRHWVVGFADVRNAIGRLPVIPWHVWLGGSGLFLAVVVIRLCWFYRRIGRAMPAPPELTKLVAEIAKSFELKRVPQCFIVRDCLSPMIWCGRRARLLIPIDLWSELDDTGRRAVLCHELAHLRRRDHWVCWVEIAVAAVYWWHPLLWWVRRRLREEAELCCDAWVTWLMPQGRRAYAEALLSTKQYVARGAGLDPVLGLGVTTVRAERFARRIRMVMTESKRPRTSVSGLALVMLIAGMGWVATPARSCPPEEQERVERQREGVERAAERQERQQERQQERRKKQERKAKKTKKAKSWTNASPDTSFEQFYGSNKSKNPMAFALASDDDDDLEDRLDRLEKQLARLSQQLKRIGGGNGPRGEAGTPFRRAPRAPRADDVGRTWVTFTQNSDERTFSRSYRLPKGQLKELTGLMVRPDVPIMVSPSGDSISVEATASQHATFKAFVEMIAPVSTESDFPFVVGTRERPPSTLKRRPTLKRRQAPKTPKAPKARSFFAPKAKSDSSDNIVNYRLTENKMEALTKLMIRPDVPVLVSPRGEVIGVHGDKKVQRVLAAFVNILEPEDADDISDGKQIQCSYKLSEGKLEALTNLMILPNVPVLIEPGDDEIGVRGNKRTHKAFKAFLKIIEPKQERSGRSVGRTTLGVVGGARDNVEAHSHTVDHAIEAGHDEHFGAHEAPAPKAGVVTGRITSGR